MFWRQISDLCFHHLPSIPLSTGLSTGVQVLQSGNPFLLLVGELDKQVTKKVAGLRKAAQGAAMTRDDWFSVSLCIARVRLSRGARELMVQVLILLILICAECQDGFPLLFLFLDRCVVEFVLSKALFVPSRSVANPPSCDKRPSGRKTNYIERR